MPTKDPDSWMWERARSMVDRADRIQRRFFQLAPPGGKSPSWEPPIDVFETATELWILVALPGVELDAIEVLERQGMVRIAGQRNLPEAFRSANVHRLEIPYGRFERLIELPPGRYQPNEPRTSAGCVVLQFTKLD
ncbi:MAG: Hsp20/alpha crystallin family protein [Planctomycetota bacterium]|jgi:HSP20 family molecular chaperone IbpA